ncbi:MAG TPA: methyltransferase domain-containing protein [Planctomycetota bacterium]|jgi:ubiquinone/menaquinone biosynthesis C-methylase UbiE
MNHKSKNPPWYVCAFDAQYLLRYSHRTDKAAAAEARFVAKALKLPRGAHVLDLCCGAGRHARALARMGFRVTGVDLSADLLHEAVRRRHKNITYVRADMRCLPLGAESVDGAISMFTSFGYFETDRENEKVLREVARVLKPGAPFLLDYMNLKVTLRHLVRESEKSAGRLRLIERRHYNAASRRLTKDVTVLDGRRKQVICESVRAYRPAELRKMCARAGLVLQARFGDLAGSKFKENDSARCVLLLRKRESR